MIDSGFLIDTAIPQFHPFEKFSGLEEKRSIKAVKSLFIEQPGGMKAQCNWSARASGAADLSP
jgi:hypothetical protein